MHDKLIIATKTKRTIEYIDKTVKNFPHIERNLKDRLINSSFDLLELIYEANVTQDCSFMKKAIVKIKMIDYYLKLSYYHDLISNKKYESIGLHLLEVTKMINVWLKNEESK